MNRICKRCDNKYTPDGKAQRICNNCNKNVKIKLLYCDNCKINIATHRINTLCGKCYRIILKIHSIKNPGKCIYCLKKIVYDPYSVINRTTVCTICVSKYQRNIISQRFLKNAKITQ